VAAGARSETSTQVERDSLADEIWRRLNLVGLLANGLGGVIVTVFLTFLFPTTVSAEERDRLIGPSLAVFAVYMPLSLYLGQRLATRKGRQIMDWLESGEVASDDVRANVLRYPLRFAKTAAVLWGVAALLFSAIWQDASLVAGDSVLATILLGGVTACALQFLLVERVMRPATGRALAGGPPPPMAVPGVATRLTMAWTLATGVPVLGIVALGIADLSGADLDRDQLILSTLFLALLAIVTGLVAIVLAARSVSDPVTEVQQALEKVEGGELETRVEVDDGSEVGLLQAGFNRMAAGLEERERMRDLFGRHVGHDVAQAALDSEVSLGGEVREVAALFVDLVGSTTLAARRPATEVVAVLNDFFRIVVDAAERHGGLVNKFEGDAALCVFGAPNPSDDPAGGALRAAREIRDRVRSELPDIDLGIGVSAGPAVAGNVGAEERFEYTVIGDPVNEAARLCELAKQKPERLLASESAVEEAAAEESEYWSLGDAVTLRGRDEPTRLATVPA
jgi:adenylate cyclase